jgi:hypothetical protein
MYVMFQLEQRHVPNQLPEEALSRCIWSVVEDVMKLYMTCGSRNDYYMLQCVKGAWAFLKLVMYMGSAASKLEVLLAFVRCVIAVYVARGRPFIATSNARDEDAEEEREEEERKRKAAADAGQCVT